MRRPDGVVIVAPLLVPAPAPRRPALALAAAPAR